MRFLTAGETHGKCLTAIVEGMPSNIPMDAEKINHYLWLRQQGYGRGGRMKIESDQVEFLSGVRNFKTLGSPIALKIENRDWANWESIMGSGEIIPGREVTCPRPGHADLAGGLKYNHQDLRNVLERASARETAARVAVGAVALQLLETFGIRVKSHVIGIGGVEARREYDEERLKASQLRCCDPDAEEKMIARIEQAKSQGDSVGGIFEIIITGVPTGLGSYVQWDRKLDAKLAMTLMSIQAIKGVSFGAGFQCGLLNGSQIHDEIAYDGKYYRKTNRAGGIEGGMTNGEDIVIRAAMKPIPTLYHPLETVDVLTKKVKTASVERSDVCAVPAASVVGLCAAAFEIADAFLDKFGGDSKEEIERNFEAYQKTLK